MSSHRCATCGGPLSWAWEICPACHPEDPLGGDITIHHGISGPTAECRVCAASAAEVARHHQVTVQRRLR